MKSLKILISQDMIKEIVSDHLMAKFGTDYAFECTGDPSYSAWTFEEATPEFVEAKAKHEAEMEALRVKWAAEAEAKAAAKVAIDNAVEGAS